MVKVQVAFNFNGSGYIGLPYWPERNTIIDIGKDVHPKLGATKKEQALLAALEKRGLNKEQYEEMQKKAERPFYTVDGSREGTIAIPERIIQSFINNASMQAPKAIPRVSDKGLTFIGVKIADKMMVTEKTITDAKLFERFVKMETSNQRNWCSSFYIDDFIARGIFSVDEEIIMPDDLKKLIEWGGKQIGIGSARPQGYGRFQVAGWDYLTPVPVTKPIEEE
jgi:hypothetical protein